MKKFGLIVVIMSLFSQSAALAVDGILMLQADDPRLTQFPKFKSLKPQFEFDGLFWSSRSETAKSHHLATTLCSESDGARLPTLEEYQRLAAVLGYPDSYDRNAIPKWSGAFYWTDSHVGYDPEIWLSRAFDGEAPCFASYNGKALSSPRMSVQAFQCVLPISRTENL